MVKSIIWGMYICGIEAAAPTTCANIITRHNLMVMYKVLEIDFSCVSIICILIDEYLYKNMTLD